MIFPALIKAHLKEQLETVNASVPMVIMVTTAKLHLLAQLVLEEFNVLMEELQQDLLRQGCVSANALVYILEQTVAKFNV